MTVAAHGGDCYNYYGNTMSAFKNAIKTGADMIETDVDFRYLCIRKKYAAKLLGISDVVQPETTITVYDYIRSNLTQQKQMQFVQIAAQDIAKSLNVPANVERKKEGDALNKLLEWEN